MLILCTKHDSSSNIYIYVLVYIYPNDILYNEYCLIYLYDLCTFYALCIHKIMTLLHFQRIKNMLENLKEKFSKQNEMTVIEIQKLLSVGSEFKE